MNLYTDKRIRKIAAISISVILLVIIIAVIINQSRLTGPEATQTGPLEVKSPSAIGNISYSKVKVDANINAIIDSSQKLDNGNLLVKFHHNSNKEELLTSENLFYNREQLFYGREHV